jgi:hypothetical protein
VNEALALMARVLCTHVSCVYNHPARLEVGILLIASIEDVIEPQNEATAEETVTSFYLVEIVKLSVYFKCQQLGVSFCASLST